MGVKGFGERENGVGGIIRLRSRGERERVRERINKG